jgi:acetolactate synthase I/II/III large subunit
MKLVGAVAEALSRLPHPCSFGIIGDGNLELVARLHHGHGVPWVPARHEQGATAMADGYTRSGRGIGLALLTHGPGLTNAATSIKEAASANSPVLVVVGDTPTDDDEHFQDLDQMAMATCLVGPSATSRPSRAADVSTAVSDAIWHVTSGLGPYVLHLPTDILHEDLAEAIPARPRQRTPSPLAPAPDAISAVSKRLETAKRPLVLAGRGVLADAREGTAQLATRLGAPLFTTLRAIGAFHDHPLAAGLAGGFGRDRCTAAFDQADCVIVLGASLSRYTTREGRLLQGKEIIRVDEDSKRLESPAADVRLAADVGLTLTAIGDELGQSTPRVPWFAAVPDGVSIPDAPVVHAVGTVDPRALLRVIDEALPERRHVVVDAGHFTTFACGMLSIADPSDLVFPVHFGAVGQGLPTAIGTAVAHSGERVVAVVGDGGFMLALPELDTAVRLGVPLTVVVVNDEAYGQEVHVMRALGLPADTAQVRSPDLAALATSLGAAACTIRTESDLRTLPTRLKEARGVLVVDARVNPDVRNWRVEERFGP